MKRAALTALLVAVVLLAWVPFAHAFQVGIQDQGATLHQTIEMAHQLGATTVRVIATPTNPELGLVRAYHAAGLDVQAAVLVKRHTTAGDIRGLLKSWDNKVKTVSIGNEPELNGVPPCTYARLYRRAYLLIRREFPHTRIGFGEFSPNSAMEYMRLALNCKGPRLRADFFAIHPYQMQHDPLATGPEIQATGLHWGMGRLHRVYRELRTRKVLKRLATPRGRALPIYATEFSYLTTGRYGVSPDRTAWLWPRAVRQARKWTEQLVIYGIGAVHDQSNWGSASLIDRHGRRLPGLIALARALGRVLPREADPEVPPRLVVTEAPGPSFVVPERAPAPVPVVGEGASVEDPVPVVIEDPVLDEDTVSEVPSEPSEPLDVPVSSESPDGLVVIESEAT